MATSADLAALLRDLLREDGPGILEDRSRLGPVLRERRPDATRAIHLLLTAVDAGVPVRLRAGEGEAGEGEIGQETSQLVDHFGVASGLAREAVETWAMALGRRPGPGEPPRAEDTRTALPIASDAASSDTTPRPDPRSDEGVPDVPVGLPVLPALPPLPSSGAGHRDSVLADPGPRAAERPGAPDLRPILPRPPDLPVPSPASTGPVAREAAPGAAPAAELPPVRSLPPVQPLPPAEPPSAPAPAAQPSPPVQALPPVQELPRVRDLPPVEDLPPVQVLPPVRPLPAGTGDAKPLPPVRPLPTAAPSVQPLPGPRPLPPSGSILPPGPPAGSAQSSPPARPAWIAWLGGLAALAALGFGLMQLFGDGTAETPVKPPDPPPRIAERPAERPSTAGGQTAEGFPIVDAQTEPNLTARPLDGNPNTMLFAFGLRFGQETYTYQAAVDFSRGDANGVGLVKVFKGGRESATGELRTSRSIQSNGYLGFTMSGPMRGAVSAPNVCVSALVGRTPGRFDLANGGGLFCAFATKPDGLCDGDVKIGCGKLVP